MPEIHDTTLRDGEQMPGVIFTPEEKLKLAERFVEFGVNYLDIMPSVSASEARLAKELTQRYGDRVSASCRLNKEEVKLAKNLGIARITLFTPVSDLHLQYKLRISRDENLERGIELVNYAVQQGMKVDFAFEDATRADESYLVSYLQALQDRIAIAFLADTVGALTPNQSFGFFQRMKPKTKARIGIHAHNDFGLATANTLAALRGGAEVFSGTFNGIGERAGNTPIEEVCCALRYLYDEPMAVKYEMLKPISEMVQKFSGIKLQHNKAIVGTNAFSHESGIHVDGMIKHPKTYELMNPKDMGSERIFYFGKTSGKGSLKYALGKEAVSERDMARLLEEIKLVSESSKLTLSQTDMHKLHESIQEEALSYGMIEESLYEFDRRNTILKEFVRQQESDQIRGVVLIGYMAHSPDKITKDSDLDLIVIYSNRGGIAEILNAKKMQETAEYMASGLVDVVRNSEDVNGTEFVRHIMPLDIFLKICDSSMLYLKELRDYPKNSAKIPTFGGDEKEIDLQMVHKKEGYLIRVPVSLEIEGKYFGGPHQDMLLANPRVLRDYNELLRHSIDTLWYRVVERYWNEYRQIEIGDFIKKFKRYLNFSDETKKFLHQRFFDTIRQVMVSQNETFYR